MIQIAPQMRVLVPWKPSIFGTGSMFCSFFAIVEGWPSKSWCTMAKDSGFARSDSRRDDSVSGRPVRLR
jgi:hypothetical protein